MEISESPNRVLHDIIAHNIEKNVLLEIDGIELSAKIDLEEVNDDALTHMANKTNLFPRILKATNKGKKQGDDENAQPITIP